jgi:hypothetical protein
MDLQTVVSHFGGILQFAERCCVSRDSLDYTLCELSAMQHAYMIRACIDESVGMQLAHVLGCEVVADHPGGQRGLPKPDEAGVPARGLFSAVASGDRVAILNSLEGMGVLALCPIPQQQISEMERIVGGVIGRAKLVYLVELSFFAAEIGDYERATKYASEAHGFRPVAWQLYSLSIIEGLAALDAGKEDEAIQYLRKSIGACMTDVRSCLACGISEPNFRLAEKLFERGEKIEVLRHLSDCKDVWPWPQIVEWIRTVESGGKPDFRVNGTWRLATQCRNARLIDSGQDQTESSMPQSRDQVIAEVKRMRAEFTLPKNIPVPSSARTSWPGTE